jgi:hypothetical protein
MQIEVVVNLADGDSFAYTADAAASQVLAALGGNPTVDHCTAIIAMPRSDGSAGTPPVALAAAAPTEESPSEE